MSLRNCFAVFLSRSKRMMIPLSDSPSTPGTPRRRSSATNLSNTGRRSSSVNPLEKRSTSPRSSSKDLLHKTKGFRKVSSSSIIKQQQCLQPGIKSMSDRSDSSCSIPSTSNLGDSGSEVSDEGYKSCQGIPPPTAPPSVEPRPESSLTVGSDCSSTISSDTDEEEDKTDSTSTWLPATTPKKKTSMEEGMNRSQSINSVHSAAGSFTRGGPERRSYRTANSRYMQAAEAYAAKRGAGKPRTLAADPRRNYARSSSASPSPYVRSSPATTPQLSRRKMSVNTTGTPSSTQSTPARKPPQSVAGLPSIEAALGIDGEDDDVLILKKLEEILLTYKSRVEGQLAAEGRQLPKEIFEDFTSHWVNSTSKEPDGRSEAVMRIMLSPTPRKEFREKKDKTKIPVPTFYTKPDTPPHR